MNARVPLSVLELAPVSQGSDAAQALRDATALAQTADERGYRRFWVAEHHASETFMSSATSILIAHVACHTSRIRLGSGGVMLPNHAPLMVAEYYGTLATLYGDRIDLGLGRAPGTDALTARALHRGSGEIEAFAQNVVEIAHYLAEPNPQQPLPVRAIPGEGTAVPIWLLGSSLGGASVAAYLGLPFSFASHFAPDALVPALDYYRQHFNPNAPTAQIERPYVMAGINVMCAPTDEEAAYLGTTAKRLTQRILSGERAPLDPPDRALMSSGPRTDGAPGRPGMPVRAIGSPGKVVDKMQAFVDQHQLDELIITTYAWDPVLRRRSFELLADAWGMPGD